MNCGTFELMRLKKVIDELIGVGEQKHCATCLEVLDDLRIVKGGYTCKHCDSLVCIVCGCTEEYACEGDCHWVGPGFCSAHLHEFETKLTEALNA